MTIVTLVDGILIGFICGVLFANLVFLVILVLFAWFRVDKTPILGYYSLSHSVANSQYIGGIMIPYTDPSEITQGLMGLHLFVYGLSPAKLGILADLVPERGEAMWRRFTTWRDGEGDGKGLNRWLSGIIMDNGAQGIYPKGCTLNPRTRELILGGVIEAIGTNRDDELIAVHFEINPFYDRARSVACKGCPRTNCRHYFDPHRRPRFGQPPQRPPVTRSRPRPTATAPSKIKPAESTMSLDELKRQCTQILRDGNDKKVVKMEIKRLVRKSIKPRPRTITCTVTWSHNPASRRVRVDPEGFEAFTVHAG